MPVRCYSRKEFEKILTGNLNLKKTDEVVDGERAWETKTGKYLFISDISDSEALPQSYVHKIYQEVLALDQDIEPPDFYPIGL